MTGREQAGTRILGSLRSAEGKGIVRTQDTYETDIDDLWSAFTDPGRLARWLGEIEGDLRVGGEFSARFFATGWEGTAESKHATPRIGCFCGRETPMSRTSMPSRYG